MFTRIPKLASLTVLFATLSAPAFAQQRNTAELFTDIQWNFSTPGARANGMGATFIAVADDATAAVTNPAGLTYLTRPQFYVEFANSQLKVPHLLAANSLVTANATDTSTNLNTLSFASVSTQVGPRFAIGFTAHQLLNFQDSFQDATRVIPPDFKFIYLPASATIDYHIWTYSGTVAARLHNTLRVGMSLSVSHLNGTSSYIEFEPAGTQASNIVVDATSSQGGGNGFGLTAGALYQPTQNFSVGLSYSKGPSLSGTSTFQVNPGSVYRTSTLQSSTNQPLQLATEAQPFTVHVPDRLGAGVAIRPVPALLLALDAVHVRYSQLAPDLFPSLSTLFFDRNDLSFPDVTEAHLGGEYQLVTGPRSVLVRAGLATEPDHGIRSTQNDPFVSVLYNQLPRTSHTRGTVGVGFVLGSNAQIDAAYVWNRQFIVSAGVRF